VGDNKEERKRNSLRCDDANIKVIDGGEQGEENKEGDHGGGNNTTKDETPTKKVFWHYSQVLTSQSRYVDALISTPLAAAAASKKYDRGEESKAANFTEITFPDISPCQWERMIKFLTDPVAARDMNKEDAIELFIPYDKYDFIQGIRLCGEILPSMFYEDWEVFKKHMNDLDLLDRCVNVVVLSHEKNLKETMENAKYWLYDITVDGYGPELVILTVDHVRKLVPVIVSYKDDRNDPEQYTLQNAIGQRLGKKGIDVLSPMFPDFFVAQVQLIVAWNTALKLVNEITIENCGGHVSGNYDPDMDGDFGINGTCIYYKRIAPARGYVWLKKNEVGDWIISEYLRDSDVVPLFRMQR
jgi:hypothetical protein